MKIINKKTVLGIDPGFASLGYAFIDDEGGHIIVRDYGRIKTPSRKPLAERLNILFERISRLIVEHHPSCVAIEKIFFEKNIKTAIDVAQARGVILLVAYRSSLPIFEYTPLQIKLAVTGYGKAEKQQVQHMITRLLRLSVVPTQDDAADALAIAYCAVSIAQMRLR